MTIVVANSPAVSHLLPFRSKEAEQRMYKENLGLARSVAFRFINSGRKARANLEDHPIYSDACYGLLLAIRSYNPYLSAFSTYAMTSIKNTILRTLLREQRINKIVSCQETIPEVFKKEEQKLLDADKTYVKILEYVSANFNEKDIEVFQQYFIEGKTQKEIAAQFGISQQRINQRVTNLMKKMNSPEVKKFILQTSDTD
jgi:RNA polymerase sigma factor (sigma-70 family)